MLNKEKIERIGAMFVSIGNNTLLDYNCQKAIKEVPKLDASVCTNTNCKICENIVREWLKESPLKQIIKKVKNERRR